jgi:site-specific DNA-cytosine methylase
MMKIGSICSGMGMALHGIGKPVWAIEYDQAIAQCYRENHGDGIIVDAVERVAHSALEDVDLVIATPSCVRASIASQRGESEEDINVASAVATILDKKLPKFFILENVEGYKNFRSFGLIKGKCTNLGYHTTVLILNLKDFGIAQSRKRLYLIASQKPFFDLQIPYVQRGWYEAVKDLWEDLPEVSLSTWQLKPHRTALIRRCGANKSNNRAYLPHEPSFTIRAFGRKASHHWHQGDVVVDGHARALTPRAMVRLFGDKATADKIWLPSSKSLACEVVGNGASWEIFQNILGTICQ